MYVNVPEAPWAVTRSERFWHRVFSTPGVPGHKDYMRTVQLAETLARIASCLEIISELLDVLEADRS